MLIRKESVIMANTNKAYISNNDIPNLDNPSLNFAIIERANGPICYCYTDAEGEPEKTWQLTKAGWKVLQQTDIFVEYGFDVDCVSRTEFLSVMSGLLDSGWFFDFVDKK